MSGLGVTGPRAGMSGPQRDWTCRMFEAHAKYIGLCDVHHGDCIGVDVQFAVIAKSFGFRTVAHPPTKSKYRAYHDSDVILDTDDYYPRNRDIVRSVDNMIGFPSTDHFVEPSGTWYTISYAVETSVDIVVVGRGGVPLALSQIFSSSRR